jgi:hypothetical protein
VISACRRCHLLLSRFAPNVAHGAKPSKATADMTP